MRKLVKTKWGIETIFSQEDWFTGSFIEIGFGKKTDYEKATSDIIYYIMDGSVQVLLNGSLYEFTSGKTILIKRGTKYQLIGTKSVPKLIKISRHRTDDKDLSSVTKSHV